MLELVINKNGTVLSKNSLPFIETNDDFLFYLNNKIDLEKDNLIIDLDFVYMGRLLDYDRVYRKGSTGYYYIYLEDRDDILIGTSVDIESRFNNSIKRVIKDDKGNELSLDYTEDDLQNFRKQKNYNYDII